MPRPRKPDTPTASERARQHTLARVAAGGRRLTLLLDAEAATDLDWLLEHAPLPSAKAVIQAALRHARESL